MQQITKQSVKKALHRNHFFVNSHYISNIIVIRNNQRDQTLFPDTLIIFCNGPLSCSWNRYNVSLQSINNCVKEGQYINAFKFGKLKNQDVFIQDNPITLVNSEQHEQVTWVFYKLTRNQVFGTTSRDDDFRPDPAGSTTSAQLTNYKGSGYDRAHLCHAADMKISPEAMSELFYLSNM